MSRVGTRSEKKIQFCTKDLNPCKNGATCVDRGDHYACQCALGFSGENCTVNNDDCISHMCQNGGTLVDGINECTCKCPPAFSGKFCEAYPMVSLLYPQTSPCQQHDCQNGICFQPQGLTDYICKYSAAQPQSYMNTLKTSVLTSYDPCKDHRCRKGQCVSKKNGKNYSCKCQARWGGKY
ncbi:hypothetical protein DAPPUDRAFT_267546 [Daphnia pulex]|uniref:EGF-like domain-containing protein n=1 Tax=Daphnia pulex TaxID=6669 RepID=E9HWM7_DAPPU|nr:hypothetical protein DAPPUDRAFT_267546 [Daphnia pulex]|eukprot:EFX63854.1 hypothetical protein DAPPUDRAFT_267546 [Daphnia pulex]